jgi:uncharacterized protein (DUF1697 family)
MSIFIGLLRAINVGGTGSLAMTDLKAMCEGLGLTDVRTYIQSGNVIFGSTWAEPHIKTALEEALSRKMGKPIRVLVRSAREMRAVLDGNPFPGAPASKVSVVFLDQVPTNDVFANIAIPGREQVCPAGREVYVHYPDGMGRSKLRLPAFDAGTSRNLNTVAKLADMANEAQQRS